MRTLALLAIVATPALIGIDAVIKMPGPAGFAVAVGASLVMLREAVFICLMMMRHWQHFGRDFFLIAENGRERWVDRVELMSLGSRCEVLRQEFRLDLFDPRRRR